MKISKPFFVFVLTFSLGVYAYMFFFVSLSPESTPEELQQQQQQEEKHKKQQKSVYANQILSKVKYMKDSRTGLCFAYFWGGDVTRGGPALATVPCDRVPRSMLK